MPTAILFLFIQSETEWSEESSYGCATVIGDWQIGRFHVSLRSL